MSAPKNRKGPRRPNIKKAANFLRLTLFWAIIVVAALALMAIVAPPEKLDKVSVSDVISRANKGEISKIEGQGGDL